MSDATIIGAINGLISDENRADGLSMSTIEALMARYPYFSLPSIIKLRDGSEELTRDDRRMMEQHLARTATTPIVLATLLNEEDAPFYPEEETKTPTTESAIDTFLSTYGDGGEDDEVLNRLIFNPTPDYAQLLAQEEQQSLPVAPSKSGDSHDDLLNRFILKQKQLEGSVPQEEPSRIPSSTVENRHNEDGAEQQADNTLLSESLAKIFIRQHQYERAYEIISQLSLKYPEKSVYFADQMRFIRKVLNNRRFAEVKNG